MDGFTLVPDPSIQMVTITSYYQTKLIRAHSDLLSSDTQSANSKIDVQPPSSQSKLCNPVKLKVESEKWNGSLITDTPPKLPAPGQFPRS